MTDIVFVCEVHQPFRMRRNFFWDRQFSRRVGRDELFDYYFDTELNREIFQRVAKKCYYPTNNVILGFIDDFKRGSKQAKFSFSLSGVFLEQCEAFDKGVLESFRHLAETGCVEFLDQTYWHSLSSLYPDRGEYVEQVEAHRRVMKDLLGVEPKVLENTELIYNNVIARDAERMGYSAIYTEGVERILTGRSPNYVYSPEGCGKTRVLLRNYRLSDDVGFRFSQRSWDQWPLTADKYAMWLSDTQGQCVNIFIDYETFGEHHWPETGIHEFLANLPREILKHRNLTLSTPSEVVEKHQPVGVIDVEELGGTISWADLERDTSCWLGNTMQWAYYRTVRDMEKIVKESGDQLFLRIWRNLQASDHLHNMFMAGGSSGEVHDYFSVYESPYGAFVTSISVSTDFEQRVRSYCAASNEPFRFYTDIGEENDTGIYAVSLMGLLESLRSAPLESIRFHNRRGDFEKWATLSLKDRILAEVFRQIGIRDTSGEDLRKSLIKAVQNRLKELAEEYSVTTGIRRV